MSLEISGMEQLTKDLMNMVSQVEDATNEALNNAADIQVKELKNTIFVDSGKARDEIIKGKPYKVGNQKYIDVGWGKESESWFRVHFPEGGTVDKWGTVLQPPQRKIEKSVKNSNEAQRTIILKTLQRKLKY